MMDAKQRFMQKVCPQANGCLNWTGGTTTAGYGITKSSLPPFNIVYVGKAAWELEEGPVPDGKKVVQKCGNKLCANPSHLELIDNTKPKPKVAVTVPAPPKTVKPGAGEIRIKRLYISVRVPTKADFGPAFYTASCFVDVVVRGSQKSYQIFADLKQLPAYIAAVPDITARISYRARMFLQSKGWPAANGSMEALQLA